MAPARKGGEVNSDWRDQAACTYVDPDLWFPEKGESSDEAKRICRTCPVQADCLADALAHYEQYGIWGGHSARKLRKLRDTAERQVAA